MKNHDIQHLSKIDSISFRNDLISWFEKEQRDLPWRKDQDPYKVWVSEIMLQQTRVETVIPYFNRFIDWFPTLEEFAEADEERILKAWEGLGYYSRVRNLHSAVKEVQETYNGVVPDTPAEISKLKGVGPYTAGAILSIAYGKAEPAVDGNVMRVLSRILLIKEDIAKPKTRKIFEDAIRELIDPAKPSFFNQALMELGALICTPGVPACLLCPVREHCFAFQEGVQAELPVKNQTRKSRDVQLVAAIITNEKDEFLIHKRAAKGLLANLWEFPNFEIHTQLLPKRSFFQEQFEADFGVKPSVGEFIAKIDHVFSHLVWNVDTFSGKLAPLIDKDVMESSKLRWVSEKEMEDYAFPVSHQKMFAAYKSGTKRLL
ncbi:A/G-specific adenine glycosylase [Peribacillus cavernae]|uniref:Adenine DNA glycosylase n=1 Tax=Peribacillus cavernae TaxID=1674310 RepID=A0A3S0TWW2_9BACI|nr:A/G-specific adenine glycosylase [Peribacillus cavernae]MDQ0220857.1 A/G-specific adenine glycosylase [Peribacillus cavernae]RUQ24863.1 A/G-specific adenine glycosylase [Peribacillus cavernae]